MPFQSFDNSVHDEGYLSYLPFQSFDSSVPDEGYFRNASCALKLISTILF